jgi:hypothetical protein
MRSWWSTTCAPAGHEPMMRRASLTIALSVLCVPAAAAQDVPRLEIGPRLLIVTAGGVPTNDMSGYGVQGLVRWRSNWRLGFALDSMGGDFEVPNEIVQITTPEVLDAKMDTLVLSAWVERAYRRWFWTAGLGFASPDVDDLAGPATAGGSFNLTTDAGSETILSATAGGRWSWGERLRAEAALRVDHHLADWTVRDRVSGRTGSIDDYTAYGVHAGVSWRF